MSEFITIKELRKSVNMTQSQFAKWLSTSIENVKNWERGKSQPSEMLLKLISYYVEGHKQGEQIDVENVQTAYILMVDHYDGITKSPIIFETSEKIFDEKRKHYLSAAKKYKITGKIERIEE